VRLGLTSVAEVIGVVVPGKAPVTMSVVSTDQRKPGVREQAQRDQGSSLRNSNGSNTANNTAPAPTHGPTEGDDTRARRRPRRRTFAGREDPEQYRHPDRREQTATHTLEDAEDDEWSDAAQDGRGREDHRGGDERTLVAEAVSEPARRVYAGREADQVRGRRDETSVGETLKSLAIVGIATVSAVLSKVTRNSPAT